MELAQLDEKQREPLIPVRWHLRILFGLAVVVEVVVFIVERFG